MATYDFRWHVYSSQDRACSAEVYREEDAHTIARVLTESTGYEHTVHDQKPWRD